VTIGSIGDVASACGPSPCGFMDNIFPTAACDTWKACAANQAPVLTGPCVVGGLDANGNTIVSCGGVPCLMGTGPLQPGQEYCAGVLDAAQLASAQALAAQPTANNPPWLLLGFVALGLVLMGTRR
jgi:hypothetical protein